MGNVKVVYKELEEFKKKIEKLNEQHIQVLCEDVIKNLAARLLTKAIKRTPVGKKQYRVKRDEGGKRIKFKKGAKKGSYRKQLFKMGGTLRRGWTAATEQEALDGKGMGTDVNTFVGSVKVQKTGNTYRIEIDNPVHYASYVEHGRRRSKAGGWVRGHFMLTISEKELTRELPRILEKRLTEYFEGVMK